MIIIVIIMIIMMMMMMMMMMIIIIIISLVFTDKHHDTPSLPVIVMPVSSDKNEARHNYLGFVVIAAKTSGQLTVNERHINTIKPACQRQVVEQQHQ